MKKTTKLISVLLAVLMLAVCAFAMTVNADETGDLNKTGEDVLVKGQDGRTYLIGTFYASYGENVKVEVHSEASDYDTVNKYCGKITIKVTPELGYTVVKAPVCDSTIITGAPTVAGPNSDGTITYTYNFTTDSNSLRGAVASFTVPDVVKTIQVGTTTIIVNADHGEVSAEAAGTDIVLTVKPDSGYEIADVKITDKNGDPVKVVLVSSSDDGEKIYQFINTGDVNVDVTFESVYTPEEELDVVKQELLNKINELQAQIGTLPDGKNLQDQIDALKADITKNYVDLNKLQTYFSNLKSQIDALNDTYATDTELSNAIAGIQTQIDTINNTIKTLATKAELEAAKEELQGKIKELEDKIKVLGKEDTNLSERLDLARTECIALIGKLKEDLNALDSTYATDAELSNAIAGIQTQIDTINKTINTLATKAELDAAKEALQAQITELQGKVTAGDEALQAQITALQTQLVAINEAIDALDGTYATDTDINNIKTQLADLLARLEALENKINNVIVVGNYKVTVLANNATFSYTVNEHGCVRLKLIPDEGYKVNSVEIIYTADGASVSNISYWDGKNGYTFDVDADITVKVDMESVEITELQQTIADLQDKIDKIKTDYATNADVQAKVEALQGKLNELDQWFEGLEFDFRILQQDVQRLKNQIDALDNTYATDAELKDAIDNIQSQIDTINATIKTLATKEELQQAVKDLNAAIAAGDLALAGEIKTLNQILEDAKAALEAADEANKAELTQMIKDAEASLKAAIEKVQQNLDEAIAKLKEVIADGDEYLGGRIDDLTAALQAAKAALEAADEANKAELTQMIKDAEASLKAAIEKVQQNLDEAIAKLKEVIADGDEYLGGRIDNLTAALQAAKAALEAADGANKAELEKKIADAEASLKAAIEKVQQNLDAAEDALNKAIIAGDKKLDEKIEALNKALADAKAALGAADSANKKALEEKINSVNETLSKKIADLRKDLAAAVIALKTENAMQNTAFILAVEGLNRAIKAAEEFAAAGDAALDAKLAEAVAAFEEALNIVQKNLDDAKAELNKAIADGDTALDGKITALNEALATAKAALEAADAANKTELTTKIEEAYASLDAAIKAVQNNVDELRTALEAKDKALQTFIIIVCVISVVTFCGTTTLVVLYVIDKKKRI